MKSKLFVILSVGLTLTFSAPTLRAEAVRLQQTFNKDGYVNALAFSPDNQFVAFGTSEAGFYGTRALVNLSTGVKVEKSEVGSVYSMAFSPDGKKLAVGTGNFEVEILELAKGSKEIIRRSSIVTSLAFSPDGKKLASAVKYVQASRSTLVQVHDLEKNKAKTIPVSMYANKVLYLSFYNDSKNLLLATNESVSSVDLETGLQQILSTYSKRTGDISAASLAANDNSVLIGAVGRSESTSSGFPEALPILEFLSKQGMRTVFYKGLVPSIVYAPSEIALSPDGNLAFVFVLSEGSWLFNTRTGVKIFDFPKTFVSKAVFSANSKMLLIAGDAVDLYEINP